jgi:hypothetical protein
MLSCSILVLDVPVKQAVHEETGVLLQIERVDRTCASIVPAGEIGDEDDDCGNNVEQRTIGAEVVIWSQDVRVGVWRLEGDRSVIFDPAVGMEEERLWSFEGGDGLSDAMPVENVSMDILGFEMLDTKWEYRGQ